MRPFGTLFPAAAAFAGYSTVYVGSATVPVPAGAKTLMAEAISGGGDAAGGKTSGAGGSYARRNAFTLASVSGLTAVTVTIPADQANATVTGNDSANTVIVLAPAPNGVSPASQSAAVGDVFNAGGAGQSGSNSPFAGGGAGGPNGPGGSDSGITNTPGAGGGGAAGAGGVSGANGSLYGGGAGKGVTNGGAQGWVKLTWS